MLEWRLEAYRYWIYAGGTQLGARALPEDRPQRHLLLLSAQIDKKCPQKPG